MKLFRNIILALSVLTLASCAMDEVWEGVNRTDSEEVVMTFIPRFDDFETATKVIGDGAQVNTLLVHVYEGSSNTPYKYTYSIYKGDVQSNVSIPFFYGKEYKVYFFAYKAGEETAYTIADNGLKGGVTVTYPTESLGFDALEALDAFYAVKDVKLSANVETSVSLKRPFAQVNLTANKAQLLAAKVTKVEIAVSAAIAYDFEDGPLGESELSFTFASEDYFQNNEEISDGIAYLGTSYLFVPSEGALSATVKLYDESGNILKESSDVQIPLVSNNRTNLVFTGIEPAGPEGIIISTPEELKTFLLNGAEEAAKAVVTADIDMSGITVAPIEFKSLELDGNGKIISGLSFSLFNVASDLTVSDLTIAESEVKGKTHTGALVNTLKGSASFSNVKVVNTSVSATSGAAGGIVGYISKSTEKDRAMEYSVSFDGCEVNGVTVSGSSSEGKFVGLMSGYDNQETLMFTNCSTTETSVADYSSAYISANQSAWLDPIDGTYDGWLGHETYRRGVVKFDGNRLVPRWDGTVDANVKSNLLLNNGASGKYEVYSPYDLAAVRNTTASPAALYLMENVDMFGQGVDGKYFVHDKFTQSKNASTDDKNFTAFSSIALLEGNNKGIYNLALNANGSDRYAFILSGNNGDQHKNVSFHNCCTVVPHVVKDNEDKSYGATVVLSISGATYTMDNVHAYNCKVFALQKTGIIAGRVTSLTMATISNCSVNDCYIENYDCKDHAEAFGSGKISTTFYTPGEVGGFIGFVENFATISNCHVKGTTIYAFGQDNKKLLYIYTVYGRHVGQFIGDIRTSDDEKDKIVLTNCTVDSNTKCTKRWDKHGKCNMMGCVYSLPLLDSKGTVTLDGKSIF